MSNATTEVDMTETSGTSTHTPVERMTNKQWLQTRKDAGARIDPETAEVMFGNAAWLDPLPVDPDLSEEENDSCRYADSFADDELFARSPGSDIWVRFDYLPGETVRRICEIHWPKQDLAGDLLFGDLLDLG
jgi:hypothetical protein